jgi:acyl-coenzyme A thioesterase PaaI-like protein
MLYAEATCIKLGRTVAFMEASLTDADGKLLAKMSTTAAPRAATTALKLVEVAPQ